MKNFLSFIHLIFTRFPFTLFTLTLLAVAAWVTETVTGKMTADVINRLGFAPRDLFNLDLWRMITSLLVTDGSRTFWLALLMVFITVGSAEWLAGTLHTILTFWGVHLLTLAIQSLLIVWPMHLFGFNITTALLLARDVGPSAGYFACFGLALYYIMKPWNWIISLIIFASLAVSFTQSLTSRPISILELSADMAHLIAFPLGWLSGLIKLAHRI